MKNMHVKMKMVGIENLWNWARCFEDMTSVSSCEREGEGEGVQGEKAQYIEDGALHRA
jgi:hypothetical protein